MEGLVTGVPINRLWLRGPKQPTPGKNQTMNLKICKVDLQTTARKNKSAKTDRILLTSGPKGPVWISWALEKLCVTT